MCHSGFYGKEMSPCHHVPCLSNLQLYFKEFIICSTTNVYIPVQVSIYRLLGATTLMWALPVAPLHCGDPAGLFIRCLLTGLGANVFNNFPSLGNYVYLCCNIEFQRSTKPEMQMALRRRDVKYCSDNCFVIDLGQNAKENACCLCRNNNQPFLQ